MPTTISIKNFVDLLTNQSIAGVKNFTSSPTFNSKPVVVQTSTNRPGITELFAGSEDTNRKVTATFNGTNALRLNAVGAGLTETIVNRADTLSNTASGSGWYRTTSGILVQGLSSVVLLNAQGNSIITYPVAFNSIICHPVMCSGDGAYTISQVFASSGNGSFAIVVTPNPGAVNVRVNWFAWGT